MKFYTPQEVADILGIAHFTIMKWLREEKIRATRFGPKTIRISATDLEAFVDKHRSNEQPPKKPKIKIIGKNYQAQTI